MSIDKYSHHESKADCGWRRFICHSYQERSSSSQLTYAVNILLVFTLVQLPARSQRLRRFCFAKLSAVALPQTDITCQHLNITRSFVTLTLMCAPFRQGALYKCMTSRMWYNKVASWAVPSRAYRKPSLPTNDQMALLWSLTFTSALAWYAPDLEQWRKLMGS